jgi:transcriptional regulator with XRE-family HTH domain
MTINERLKEFIENENLSIKEFAKKIDMSYESLQPYTINRKNNRKPGIITLQRLFKAGCDLNWLITGEKMDENSELEKKINAIVKIFKKYDIQSIEDLEKQLKSLRQIKFIIEDKI